MSIQREAADGYGQLAETDSPNPGRSFPLNSGRGLHPQGDSSPWSGTQTTEQAASQGQQDPYSGPVSTWTPYLQPDQWALVPSPSCPPPYPGLGFPPLPGAAVPIVPVVEDGRVHHIDHSSQPGTLASQEHYPDHNQTTHSQFPGPVPLSFRGQDSLLLNMHTKKNVQTSFSNQINQDVGQVAGFPTHASTYTDPANGADRWPLYENYNTPALPPTYTDTQDIPVASQNSHGSPPRFQNGMPFNGDLGLFPIPIRPPGNSSGRPSGSEKSVQRGRRNGPLTDEGKKDAGQTRSVGACKNCRRRKVKCPHGPEKFRRRQEMANSHSYSGSAPTGPDIGEEGQDPVERHESESRNLDVYSLNSDTIHSPFFSSESLSPTTTRKASTFGQSAGTRSPSIIGNTGSSQTPHSFEDIPVEDSTITDYPNAELFTSNFQEFDLYDEEMDGLKKDIE